MWLAHDASMPLASLRNRPSRDELGGGDLSWADDDRTRRRRPRSADPDARRPLLAALGLFVVLGCGALGAEVASRVDHRAAYLAVASYVPQGAVIVSSDLAVVALTSAPGVTAIPSADTASVLGRRSSEPLEPGSLLVPDDLTGTLPLPAADALVGTSLGTNEAPAGLTPGDSVIVVLSGTFSGSPTTTPSSAIVTTPTGASSSTPSAVGGATVGEVYAIELPSASDEAVSSDDELVTLEIPKSVAAKVTAASAAGDVSLAEIPATRT